MFNGNALVGAASSTGYATNAIRKPDASALQSIFDDLCTLNGRIMAIGNVATDAANNLVGATPEASGRGSDMPPSSSRIGQINDVLELMRNNMSVLELQFSRIKDAL